MFRVLIAGSRSLTDYSLVRHHALRLLTNRLPDVSVISGTCKGADLLGEQFAAEFNLPVLRFPACWDDITVPDALIRHHPDGVPYNARAGPARNQQMLDEGHPDLAIIFTRGGPGSTDMIRRCRGTNTPLVIISLTDGPQQRLLF